MVGVHPAAVGCVLRIFSGVYKQSEDVDWTWRWDSSFELIIDEC